MHRRSLIKNGLILLGGVSILPENFASAMARSEGFLAVVAPDRLRLLAEMADTILPDTDVPGAKVAEVHKFIAVVVDGCFPADKRERFWEDLEGVENACAGQFGKSFLDCSGQERVQFFRKIESEAKTATDPGSTFWQQLKSLTLNGYFTSEIGATQALAFDLVPGVSIPDMEIGPDTKAWTPMF